MKKFLVSTLAFTMFTTAHISPTFAAEEINLQEKSSYSITAEDIRFYQTLSNDQKNEKVVGLVEHKEAIKIIKEYHTC